jgi:hypothetical protein
MEYRACDYTPVPFRFPWAVDAGDIYAATVVICIVDVDGVFKT